MLTIKSEKLQLEFDEKRGVITSLSDGIREYVGEEMPVFEVSLRDNAGKQIILNTSETELEDCTALDDSFSCTYKDNRIKVKITAKAADGIEWGIESEIVSEFVQEWINYPQIAVKNELRDNGGTSKVLWGFNEGVIIEDMKQRDCFFEYVEPEYPSTGVMGMYPAIVETQFMAYYNEKSGLYFAAHDSMDYLKGVDFYAYKSGIKLQLRHFCGIDFGEKFTLSYPVVMQGFVGEWQDAAEIYRSWFENNKDERFVKIVDNKNLPGWYGESPVVVTYPVRGLHDTDVMDPNKLFPYINAMPIVERFEKELNSKIMVILMHWEGTAPWAPPYVWPPFGGEDELKKFIDALHERGDVLGVYCSGLGWTEQSNLIDEYNMKKVFDEQNLKEVMCLSPEQDLPYSKICNAQRSGYDLCPTQDFTIDVMKDQVEKMLSSGLDYIQLLDQNHGGTSYFCYSRKHGHPPVPGKWQVDAVKNILNKCQENAGKVLFGCESAAAQSYIPNLLFSDNRYNLCYSIGKPTPVYGYLYHEYLNNFMGNQVCTDGWLDHKKSPINILERFAYSFMAGDMLTLVINENGDVAWNWGMRDTDFIPDQQSIKDLVNNLNSWRRGFAKKYIHSGKMVKPYAVECGENVVERMRNSNPETFNKVYSSAWVTEAGEYGQFLINYNPEAEKCTVDLPEGEYKLYTDIDTYTVIKGGKTELEISPLTAILIEK